jgi:hypothetical protein
MDMKLHFEYYTPEKQKLWDDFVRQSFNGTFLHLRSYMDYHSDRFDDASLLIFDNAKLIGLLPAHRDRNVLYSHRGLTYGGWIKKDSFPAGTQIKIWNGLLFFLKENGYKDLHLKEIPLFYYKHLTEANRLAFQSAGTPVHTDWFWIFDTRKNKEKLLNRNRRRHLESARHIRVKESNDWDAFWEILQENLRERHQARPVHTKDEIRLLAGRFPEQIRLFGAFDNNRMIAGTTVYFHRNVLHFQYLSALPSGADRNAADKLAWEIISSHYKLFPFISLGTATSPEGNINRPLAYWKYSLGAEPFGQFFWKFDVTQARTPFE